MRYRFWLAPAIAVLLLLLPGSKGAQSIKDSESASHADESATYQVVNTYRYPGFRVIQFNLAVLSHFSYMLVSGDQAFVVDPGRDIAAYLDTAKREAAKIEGVFLTHSHADFVAGHLEVARAAGCPIYANASSGAAYNFKPLKDGSTLDIGEALIRFIETPGHTPDGLCALVYSKSKRDTPEVVFTGDTLFVGSIGRPDLLEGTMSAAHLASMMYDSWTKKLSALGDGVVIFPAHGAGSLCGAHLSDSPYSTIGAEKTSNPYLSKNKSRGEFIAAVLDGLPEAPQYFKHNAAMNRKGPEIVDWNAQMPEDIPADKSLSDPSKHYVVDLRSAEKFAESHIPGAVNIGVRGRLETYIGMMVPWGENLILCGERADLKEALHRLHRVGYHARTLVLENWQKAGLPVSRNDTVSPSQLYDSMKKGEAPIIVDVRLPNEWMGLRIGTVLNLPLNRLAELSAKLDPAEAVVTVCNSAYRSSLAVGVLERKGFKKASSLSGGSEAWIKAGLPVYGNEVRDPSVAAMTPAAPKREIRLPERISASELKRLIMDLPGTFQLVDVRPPAHFKDFNLPGSENVYIADLISNTAYLTGAGPLIVVDRDGSLAMAAAGILSQKTHRQIKALHGGLESYWAQSELHKAVREVELPGAGVNAPTPKPAAPAPHTQPDPSAPQPAKPVKKSAGC